MTRITIYDTTLRDGSQGEGVNFSLQDKLRITQRLDDLGVDYIEGGYPLSNPKDCGTSGGPRRCAEARASRRLRHDAAARRRGRGRHGMKALVEADPGRHDRRQDLGLPRHAVARHLARREPRG